MFSRRSRAATPPPFPRYPLPSPSLALLTPIAFLPTFIQSLAISSHYNLDSIPIKSLLKLALYSFALSPTSNHRLTLLLNEQEELLNPEEELPAPLDLEEDWNLTQFVASNSFDSSTNINYSTGIGGEYSESRRGKVCGHVFQPGESVYRCRDCSLDATCVLCSACFKGSNHDKEYHDITISVHTANGAGCCDCGDQEAYKEGKEGTCKFHSVSEGGMEEKVVSQAVLDLQNMIEELVRVLVDWMILVLEDSPEEIKPPRSILDISFPAPPPAASPRSTAPAPFRSNATTASMIIPPFDPNSFNFAASPPGPASSSPPRPPSFFNTTSGSRSSAIPPTTSSSSGVPLRGPWSVILWNDEKHSFAQVIDQVVRSTSVSRFRASTIAQQVDLKGRSTIFTSTDLDQILYVVKTISAIDLCVTVRPAIDVWNEEVAGELIKFLKDLCSVKVRGEGGVLTEVVAKVLLERGVGGTRMMSRFQRLVGVDARLWKEARKGLAEIYVMLLGVSPEVKKEVSVHFAQVYSNVAESYLLTDREPENSIISFGVQVFTVPSVSAYLVSQHSFLTGLISILYSFFTEQTDNSAGPIRLTLPPDANVNRIDPESSAFKQKRYFQVFGDLNHLISSPSVKLLLCENVGMIDDFSAFLDLFTSMNPNKRAVSTHVEYESDTWVTAFNVTIQLGKICRTYGEAFRLATPIQLARALSNLLSHMTGPRANLHNVSFGGTSYALIDFKVASQPISFHHPLAWLFAEMVKNVRALDGNELEAIGVGSLREIVLGRAGQLHFLAALDHPLRVVVLVAQIKAGLWVRNGFGMRAQQLHYKEYSLRENTFDQDIFFLQTAFVVLDPSLILIAILDRFQVQNWLGGEDDFSIYEPLQAFSMVEEMLYLLIVLLSDPTHAAALTSETCLRRELIHNLCLGPCPYSDLMRRVSETFADDPALDKILAEVATFKSPVGISDQGTYTLRSECFVEVDPYFPKYSRNQREEADKVVREHLKKNSEDGKEAVIVPKPLNITVGPFVSLSQAFNSDVLHQIIFFSMQHGRARGPTLFSEVLVDEALHLCMLALVEQPQSFASFASERILSNTEGETTLVHLLIKLEEDDRMKTLRHKARWCLDKLVELVGPSINDLRKIEDVISPAKALDEKRLAAKARQAAIMAQFAKAQQSFLDSSENIDDEEEEEEEGMEPKLSLGSCIVCQDELNDSEAFGCLALLQASNFIRITPASPENVDYINEVFSTPSSLDRDASAIRPFGIASDKIPTHQSNDSNDGLSEGFPQLNQSGIHASACGHMMHLACFETYYRSIEQRHHLQPARCHPENIERKEFVCPLCKSLGNVLLPATVDDATYFPKSTTGQDGEDGLDEWSRTAVLRLNKKKGTQRRVATDDRSRTLRSWSIQPMEVPNIDEVLAAEDSDGIQLMTARVLEVAYPLIVEIFGDLEKSASLHFDLLSYTISCIEIATRGQAETMGVVPEATSRMLRSLLKILNHLAPLEGLEGRIESTELFTRFGGIFGPEHASNDVFERDPLSTLVECAALVPDHFHQAVTYGFYTHLVQTYFSVLKLWDSSRKPPQFQGDASDEANEEYLALSKIQYFFIATPDMEDVARNLAFGKLLYSYSLPFLRRAVIIHSVLFGPPPIESTYSTGSEYSRILQYLRIPTPDLVLTKDSASNIFEGVTSLKSHIIALRTSIPGWNREGSLPIIMPDYIPFNAKDLPHPTIYELVGLPHQLDTLIAESLVRKCGRCGTVPTEPALCLLCCQMVCQMSFCCMDDQVEGQIGECQSHMWTCGGPVGLYYLIKKNMLLYLYTDKGSHSPPPMLDSHGEVDTGGRRGRTQFPQYLSNVRYDEVRKTWLNHGIPTFVARKLETTNDSGGWQTM